MNDASPPDDLEASVRKVGKAVLGLSLKLDDVRDRVLARLPESPPAADVDDATEALAQALDRLERTLAQWPQPSRRSRLLKPLIGQVPDDVRESLELLRRELLDALARQGLRPVACQGRFDPERHHVVGTEPGAPPGEIVRVVQVGLTHLDGRLRRPALVVVGAPAQSASGA